MPNCARGDGRSSSGASWRGSGSASSGLGRIGSQVARVCAALGMAVPAWSPSLTAERAAAVGAEYQDLDALLAEADVVTVHMRLTPASRGILTARNWRC